MKGNIVLANSKKGLVPSIIKYFTKSKFSHSLIMLPSLVGKDMCMEAASIGVSIVSFDKAYKNNEEQGYEVWEFLVDDEFKDKGISSCLDSLESDYGFLELPWFIWRAVNKTFGKDIKKQNNWTNRGTICSELCVHYLKGCGLSFLFESFGEASVCVQDLRDTMVAHPQFFKLIEVKE